MPSLKEINQRIKEVENSYRSGEMDLTESTSIIEETLKEYVGEDRVIPISEYQMPVYDEKSSFFSGIKKLDDIFGKFKKGDIFTITAPTGQGKSTFAREIFIRFAEQGKKCLYFSYEDRNEGFIEKLGKNLPEGYIPMILNDKSLTWIEARVLEAILKYNVEIVFIDNLKSITDFMARSVNNSIEFSMQRLKEIAMKYNILIFLCAHIRKDESKNIDINSIKDSSAIADISSLVIALIREVEKSEYTNITSFSVIKNRNNGNLKRFKMNFIQAGVSGRFDEKVGDLKELADEASNYHDR